MKKIYYIFLAIIYYSNSFGQITIDSIFVYQTPGTDSLASMIDSIYITGTHTGQALKNIAITPFNDICGTTIIELNFSGCDSIPPTLYDTLFTFGFYTRRIRIVSKWDTTTNCSYPTESFYTDTVLWDNCTVNTVNLIDEKQVKIYPNPARDVLKIETSQGIRPRKIQLISINGAIIKSFEPDERLLDIQSIPSGFYFLKIEMEDGYFLIKKVIIE
jgi:hypothetical protein